MDIKEFEKDSTIFKNNFQEFEKNSKIIHKRIEKCSKDIQKVFEKNSKSIGKSFGKNSRFKKIEKWSKRIKERMNAMRIQKLLEIKAFNLYLKI